MISSRVYKVFSLFLLVLSLVGCSDETANKKVEQAKLLQQQMNAISKACSGTLSLSMQLTGDMGNPATINVNCTEMNKESSYFKEFTEKDIEFLKSTIEKLN